MDEFDPKKAATDLVAAFVSNNMLAAEQLPVVLASVYSAITAMGAPVEEAPAQPVHVPKVSARVSTRDPNFIISLITGEKLKTLKRHLSSHGLTPAEYRERYNLPHDYPMVAPAYSQHRRAVAERFGLGRRPAAAPAVAAEKPAEQPVDAKPAAIEMPDVAAAPKTPTAKAVAPIRRRSPAAATSPASARKANKPAAATAPEQPAPDAETAPTSKPGRKLGLAFAKPKAPAKTSTAEPEATPAPEAGPARTSKAKTDTVPSLPAAAPARRGRRPK